MATGWTRSVVNQSVEPGLGQNKLLARNEDGWWRCVTETKNSRGINYLVETKAIPHPNDLPCMDCLDEVFLNTYRHEYDHARGYDGENQLYVEPVCSRCHHNREEARRGKAGA